jgi:hypothetical protein
MMRRLRLLELMWLLVRIDDYWDPVIIGGYDIEQKCRIEPERSLGPARVLRASQDTHDVVVTRAHASCSRPENSGVDGSIPSPPTISSR